MRSEMVVLFLGWLSSLFFFFYSEGIFNLSHQWSSYDFGFLVYAALFAVPYVLAGLSCWLLRRFSLLFFVGSVTLVVVSTWAYYSAYFPRPDPDAGWVILMVPAVQIFLVCIFSSVIFILGRLAKSSQQS